MARGKYKSTLRGYKAYVALYNAKKAEMKKKGYTMAIRKYRKIEWEYYYTAEKVEREEAIAAGKRKTIGDINRSVVKDQTYSMSKLQAKGYRDYLKTQGQKVKISDIRAGKVQVDWNAVSMREKELRNNGWGWGRVHDQISEEFFGS